MRREHNSKMALKSLAPAIPGLFTFGNLLCGFLALIHAMGPRPSQAAWFILIGGFLDFLDGKVARATNTSSSLGIQLDSLADFFTFGVAPVAMMRGVGLFDLGSWKLAVGIVYLFSGAFRLARFNVDASPEPKDFYTGLPIPAAAVTISSGILFIEEVWPPIYGTGSLGGMVVLAFLMVSNIQYPKKLKWTVFGKKKIVFLIIFCFIVILALILIPDYIIYPIMIIYIAYGLLRGLAIKLGWRKNKNEEISSDNKGTENKDSSQSRRENDSGSPEASGLQ